MLKKLRRNKKGFTLAELLIVVAIIGVLVAVSIPIFTAQLAKARVATDQANARAAKAAAVAAELTSESTSFPATYFYDANAGTVAKERGTIAVYGKSTSTDVTNAGATVFWTGDAKDKVVQITIQSNNTISVSWVE